MISTCTLTCSPLGSSNPPHKLEDHLREQVSALVGAGLAEDEAFLVAVKRMGNLDSLSREFAREHSDRLWKQLMVSPDDSGAPGARAKREAVVAFCLAAVAALAVKVPELFGLRLDEDAGFYARNMSLFVLPVLAVYFVWKREPDPATRRGLAAAFVAAVVFANVYPFSPEGYTEILTALHLPMALWLLVGIAYAGDRNVHGDVRSHLGAHERRAHRRNAPRAGPSRRRSPPRRLSSALRWRSPR